MDLNDLEAEHIPAPVLDEVSFTKALGTKKALFLGRFAYPYNRVDMELALNGLIEFILEGK